MTESQPYTASIPPPHVTGLNKDEENKFNIAFSKMSEDEALLLSSYNIHFTPDSKKRSSQGRNLYFSRDMLRVFEDMEIYSVEGSAYHSLLLMLVGQCVEVETTNKKLKNALGAYSQGSNAQRNVTLESGESNQISASVRQLQRIYSRDEQIGIIYAFGRSVGGGNHLPEAMKSIYEQVESKIEEKAAKIRERQAAEGVEVGQEQTITEPQPKPQADKKHFEISENCRDENRVIIEEVNKAIDLLGTNAKEFDLLFRVSLMEQLDNALLTAEDALFTQLPNSTQDDIVKKNLKFARSSAYINNLRKGNGEGGEFTFNNHRNMDAQQFLQVAAGLKNFRSKMRVDVSKTLSQLIGPFYHIELTEDTLDATQLVEKYTHLNLPKSNGNQSNILQNVADGSPLLNSNGAYYEWGLKDGITMETAPWNYYIKNALVLAMIKAGQIHNKLSNENVVAQLEKIEEKINDQVFAVEAKVIETQNTQPPENDMPKYSAMIMGGAQAETNVNSQNAGVPDTQAKQDTYPIPTLKKASAKQQEKFARAYALMPDEIKFLIHENGIEFACDQKALTKCYIGNTINIEPAKFIGTNTENALQIVLSSQVMAKCLKNVVSEEQVSKAQTVVISLQQKENKQVQPRIIRSAFLKLDKISRIAQILAFGKFAVSGAVTEVAKAYENKAKEVYQAHLDGVTLSEQENPVNNVPATNKADIDVQHFVTPELKGADTSQQKHFAKAYDALPDYLKYAVSNNEINFRLTDGEKNYIKGKDIYIVKQDFVNETFINNFLYSYIPAAASKIEINDDTVRRYLGPELPEEHLNFVMQSVVARDKKTILADILYDFHTTFVTKGLRAPDDELGQDLYLKCHDEAKKAYKAYLEQSKEAVPAAEEVPVEQAPAKSDAITIDNIASFKAPPLRGANDDQQRKFDKAFDALPDSVKYLITQYKAGVNFSVTHDGSWTVGKGKVGIATELFKAPRYDNKKLQGVLFSGALAAGIQLPFSDEDHTELVKILVNSNTHTAESQYNPGASRKMQRMEQEEKGKPTNIAIGIYRAFLGNHTLKPPITDMRQNLYDRYFDKAEENLQSFVEINRQIKDEIEVPKVEGATEEQQKRFAEMFNELPISLKFIIHQEKVEFHAVSDSKSAAISQNQVDLPVKWLNSPIMLKTQLFTSAMSAVVSPNLIPQQTYKEAIKEYAASIRQTNSSTHTLDFNNKSLLEALDKIGKRRNIADLLSVWLSGLSDAPAFSEIYEIYTKNIDQKYYEHVYALMHKQNSPHSRAQEQAQPTTTTSTGTKEEEKARLEAERKEAERKAAEELARRTPQPYPLPASITKHDASYLTQELVAFSQMLDCRNQRNNALGDAIFSPEFVTLAQAYLDGRTGEVTKLLSTTKSPETAQALKTAKQAIEDYCSSHGQEHSDHQEMLYNRQRMKNVLMQSPVLLGLLHGKESYIQGGIKCHNEAMADEDKDFQQLMRQDYCETFINKRWRPLADKLFEPELAAIPHAASPEVKTPPEAPSETTAETSKDPVTIKPETPAIVPVAAAAAGATAMAGDNAQTSASPDTSEPGQKANTPETPKANKPQTPAPQPPAEPMKDNATLRIEALDEAREALLANARLYALGHSDSGHVYFKSDIGALKNGAFPIRLSFRDDKGDVKIYTEKDYTKFFKDRHIPLPSLGEATDLKIAVQSEILNAESIEPDREQGSSKAREMIVQNDMMPKFSGDVAHRKVHIRDAGRIYYLKISAPDRLGKQSHDVSFSLGIRLKTQAGLTNEEKAWIEDPANPKPANPSELALRARHVLSELEESYANNKWCDKRTLQDSLQNFVKSRNEYWAYSESIDLPRFEKPQILHEIRDGGGKLIQQFKLGSARLYKPNDDAQSWILSLNSSIITYDDKTGEPHEEHFKGFGINLGTQCPELAIKRAQQSLETGTLLNNGSPGTESFLMHLDKYLADHPEARFTTEKNGRNCKLGDKPFTDFRDDAPRYEDDISIKIDKKSVEGDKTHITLSAYRANKTLNYYDDAGELQHFTPKPELFRFFRNGKDSPLTIDLTLPTTTDEKIQTFIENIQRDVGWYLGERYASFALDKNEAEKRKNVPHFKTIAVANRFVEALQMNIKQLFNVDNVMDVVAEENNELIISKLQEADEKTRGGRARKKPSYHAHHEDMGMATLQPQEYVFEPYIRSFKPERQLGT